MALSKKPYKGTRDFFPPQKRVQDYLFDTMKKTAHSFGYEHYDGPILEEVDLYLAKSGEELINEQIYSFTDRGERKVAIRPEMTPTVARMVAQVHRNIPKPIRWFSIPNLMRYERPQRGRLREHWQFNCDIFGHPENLGEVEILQVAVRLLETFGANREHFEIRINDRKVVDFVFKQLLKLDEEKSYALYKLVDRSLKLPQDKLNEQIDEALPENTTRDLFKEYLAIQSFDQLGQFLSKYDNSQLGGELSKFTQLATSAGVMTYLRYHPSIVRGLDYYTGIVFEIFDKNPKNPRAICGGGSYANLLKIFNEEPVPGVGFGLGDVTLTDFLETHGLIPESLQKPTVDIAVSYQSEKAETMAIELAGKLRREDFRVELLLGQTKMKKVFSVAEARGAKFLVLLGEDELSNQNFEIKNLENRQSIKCDLAKLNEAIDFVRNS